MPQGEHVIADYQATGLSLKAHPLSFLRASLAHDGIRTCAEAAGSADGISIRVGGVVLVRQRPGSAGGVVFATIEDETGIANVVIWPSLTENFRREIVGSHLLVVEGRIQRSPEGIIHLVADRLEDRSVELSRVGEDSLPPALAYADEMPTPRPNPSAARTTPRHPRAERVIPRSRDFH
jgi:error-prone DNA polymerase